MASGTINGSTSNSYIEAKIEWSASANNLKNYSSVAATLFYRKNSSTPTYGDGDFSITIDGKVFTASNVWMDLDTANGWQRAMSATVDVPHLSNGTKTVVISATGDINGTTFKYTNCSGTANLDTIPQASTIASVSKTDLGSPCKVTWTPCSASYYNKLTFTCGEWSHTTDYFCPGTTSLYTYTGYTFPYEVAKQFPSSTNGVMNVTLYTYWSKGGATTGDPSTSAFYVYLPENTDTKPKVTMTLSPVTPYEKFKSLYLRGISKVKATFTGEGKYSATVDYYNMSVEGKSYDSRKSISTSNILTTAGKVSVVGTGRDSRWFTNTDTVEIDVIDYKAPYISPYNGYNKVICERCTEDGEANGSGTHLHVKGTRNYTKIDTDDITNTCSVRCRYKTEGGSYEPYVIVHGSDETGDEFDAILNIELDPKVVYTVELSIIDDTLISNTMEFTISSEEVDFSLREGGKGAAFGKHATEANLFDCNWDARFRKEIIIGDADDVVRLKDYVKEAVLGDANNDENLVDFVIEQGTNDIWYYRKWHSGKVECWGRRRADVNINLEWGAIFFNYVFEYAYPSGLFASAPMCQVTAEFGDKMQSAWIAISGESTKDNAPILIVCRPNIAEVSLDILYYAIGDWK